MSSARDMATIGRRLIYDFPQYYNIFSRNSTSAGIATVRNTNRRLLDAYPGADGIKTGYTRASGLQPGVLGAARQPARHRGDDGRQDQRLAQRRGGAADGPRLRQDAGDRAGGRAARRCGPRSRPRRRRRAARPPAVVGGRRAPGWRSAPACGRCRGRWPPRPMRAQRRGHRRRHRRGERRARRRAVAQRRRRGRPRGPCRARAPRRGAAAVRGRRLDLRHPEARPPVQRAETSRSRWRAGAGSTGRNDWGVQLGAFRAKGDAERQLLTTALQDVPQLNGGLRRVEAAKVQGVDDLPRAVRRPQPGRGARRLRGAGAAAARTACRWPRGSDGPRARPAIA